MPSSRCKWEVRGSQGNARLTSGSRKGVEVQVLSSAPMKSIRYKEKATRRGGHFPGMVAQMAQSGDRASAEMVRSGSCKRLFPRGVKVESGRDP
jgi:hypothetical protein